MLKDSHGGDPDTTFQYRKRGSQVSLSNCADIFCFLEDFGVVVCKQHHTAVMSLDRHMSQYHKVPASTRREAVDCFSRLKPVDPGKIKLPEQPVQGIEQLGKPLVRLQISLTLTSPPNINYSRSAKGQFPSIFRSNMTRMPS